MRVVSTMAVELGVRVVRGPDWKWANQDGGEGHVGTVVEIGEPGSSTSPDRTVVVQWDSGSRTNYRVGYQGAYDLRVFDNAPAGVKHPNIICDACCKRGISGTRWKCTRCYDFDLCNSCYMLDKHDLNHAFVRYDTAASAGMEMAKRQGALKVQARGIFVGAKVVRGPDWDWGNQDGGEGKSGTVMDIRGWETESGQSVASVRWSSGSTNVYRLGHLGKVDLRCTQGVPGPTYYRDHLPVLGMGSPSDTLAVTPRGGGGGAQTMQRSFFSVGDRVEVLLDIESLKIMQDGHGGWNPKMSEVIGKIGTVHRVTERGDIRVQYDGSNNRWTFHPDALTKVVMFSIGDLVRICDDLQRLKEWQVGHGEYIDAMRGCVGKLGKVVKLYTDGDLRVSVDGQTWTFNPLCLVAVPGSATEISNTMTANTREEHANPAMSHLLGEQQVDVGAVEQLLRDAAQGHLESVLEHLTQHPEHVNVKCSGKSALQVASHQGHNDIVALLLQHKAAVESQDDDGDNALHYAAFGNQPAVIETLLRAGADINALNRAKCTALHVAVNKQHSDCVRVLLKFRSVLNVNIQDTFGDTALHDAIGKENLEIIDLLINVPEVDFSLKNKRGFNVLHHAALKGNNFATEKLLSRSRQIVDVKKDDGFAALHLAALNGHFAVVETLLTQGQCDVNVRNNRQQTPLLLAVSQGQCGIAELLLSRGAQLDAQDEDGDTALHVALLKRQVPQAPLDPTQCPTTAMIAAQLSTSTYPELRDGSLALAGLLAKEGANLHRPNMMGRTPLDLANSTAAQEVLRHWSRLKGCTAPLPGPESVPQGDECQICLESWASVTFEPCGHRITCVDCCARMKKCLTCRQPIEQKTDQRGKPVVSSSPGSKPAVSLEQYRQMEYRLQELEEAGGCGICLERRRNVAFLCGHAACAMCAQGLRVCHMCRQPITRKIPLY